MLHIPLVHFGDRIFHSRVFSQSLFYRSVAGGWAWLTVLLESSATCAAGVNTLSQTITSIRASTTPTATMTRAPHSTRLLTAATWLTIVNQQQQHNQRFVITLRWINCAMAASPLRWIKYLLKQTTIGICPSAMILCHSPNYFYIRFLSSRLLWKRPLLTDHVAIACRKFSHDISVTGRSTAAAVVDVQRILQ